MLCARTPAFSIILVLTQAFSARPVLPLDRNDLAGKGAGAPTALDAAHRKTAILELVDRHKESLVVVQLVLTSTMAFGGQQMPPEERRVKLDGVVLNASGLTVFSRSPLSSTKMRFGGASSDRSSEIRRDSQTKEVKIITNDGTELPAQIVLEDGDLDLAFARPKRKDLKLPAIELDSAAKPGLLDEVVSLSRLDTSCGRAPMVRVSTIAAVCTKPRTWYLLDRAAPTGSPVFDDRGRCIGVTLTFTGHGESEEQVSRRRIWSDDQGGRRAVLPAEAIVRTMKQVSAP